MHRNRPSHCVGLSHLSTTRRRFGQVLRRHMRPRDGQGQDGRPESPAAVGAHRGDRPDSGDRCRDQDVRRAPGGEGPRCVVPHAGPQHRRPLYYYLFPPANRDPADSSESVGEARSGHDLCCDPRETAFLPGPVRRRGLWPGWVAPQFLDFHLVAFAAQLEANFVSGAPLVHDDQLALGAAGPRDSVTAKLAIPGPPMTLVTIELQQSSSSLPAPAKDPGSV